MLGDRRELEPIGVVDIGSNSVRLVVYEGRGPEPDADLQREGAVRAGPRRSPRPAASAARAWSARWPRWRASAPSPASSASRTCAPSPRPPAATPPTGRTSSPRGERALGTPGSRCCPASGGRAGRQGHHDGLPRAGRPRRRPRRRQPRAHRRGGDALRQAVTLPLGGLRLIDAVRRPDRQGARHRRRAASRASPGSATGRNRSFYAVGGTWRAIARLHMEETGLSAARHARLRHAGRGGDRLLRGDPQGQEARPPCRAWRRSPGRGARCCRTARWCWSAC